MSIFQTHTDVCFSILLTWKNREVHIETTVFQRISTILKEEIVLCDLMPGVNKSTKQFQTFYQNCNGNTV